MSRSLPDIGSIDMALKKSALRPEFPQMPTIDLSYESNSTLKREFLKEKYLRILHRYGYKFSQYIGQGTVLECSFTEKQGSRETSKPLVCKKVVIPDSIFEPKKDFIKNKLNSEKLALTLTRHPNIIRLQSNLDWSNYESFDDEFPTFVLFFMERADGNLSDYLKEQERILHRPTDEKEVKLWFKMILSGLQYLH
jgi:serine/threonine protein kinase